MSGPGTGFWRGWAVTSFLAFTVASLAPSPAAAQSAAGREEALVARNAAVALALRGGVANAEVMAPAPAPAPLTIVDATAIVVAGRSSGLDGAPIPDLERTTTAQAAFGSVAERDQAALAATAVAIARVQRGRTIDPPTVDREWALSKPYDAVAAFADARRQGVVVAWALALRPTQPGYVSLAEARRRYAAIAAQGGWSAIGAGRVLAEGAVEARVERLRARLFVEGYVLGAPPTVPALFDADLTAALKAFQQHHGLGASGKLDVKTQAALDAPIEATLAAIDLNLERERWLPPSLPGDRIEVDIAGQVANVFRGQQPVMTMRVIVGAPVHHTPSFASAVYGVVFNPPWVVPSSIAAAELYPRERRSPGYLARAGFRQVGAQLVQQPGPRAALGYVKFEMDSPFGVYLHDTPSRSLFSRERRALSHGCVRLEAPRELAALLLTGQGWSRKDVDAAIAAGATRHVTLNTTTPVFVVYRTAIADASGLIATRPDVYGWDAKLAGALARRRVAMAAAAKVE
jgi:murein L,D-transpeptidase YcbB/YkuD